jgi:predicted RND superfamily exporter protein
MLPRLATWLVDSKAKVLLVLGLFTLIFATSLLRLSFDFRPDAMLKFSAEEEQFSQEFEKKFGSNDNTLLLMIQGAKGSVYTKEGLALLYEATALAEKSKAIQGGYSLVRVPSKEVSGGNVLDLLKSGGPPLLLPKLPASEEDIAKIKKQVAGSKLIAGNLVNEDASIALIIAKIKPEFEKPSLFDPEMKQLETNIDALIQKYGGFTASWGGMPYVNLVTVRLTESEQLIFWPIVGLSYFLLLFLIFRNLFQALLPLVVVGVATLWSVSLMSAAGVPFDLINNTVPKLILVVGVSNAIHVISRLLQEESRGASRIEAVQKTIVGIGFTSFLTTTTAAIGFGSLLIAHSAVLRNFGWVTAASIMMTFVAIIVLMPLLASYFHPAPASEQKANRLEPLLVKLSDALTRRPRSILVVSLVVLSASIVLGLRVPVDARVLDAFEEEHPINKTNQKIEQELGGILPVEVYLRANPGDFGRAEPLQRLAAFQQESAALDGVLSTLSLTDVLQEANLSGGDALQSDVGIQTSLTLLRSFQKDTLAAFVNADLSETHVTIRMPDKGNLKSRAVVAEIEKIAAKHFGPAPKIEYRLTGVGYLAPIGLGIFVQDLIYSLIVATILIFIGLFFAFRSWRVVFVSALPNLLPMTLTLASMPLFGYELNTASAMVFSINIGLSVDNSINIISRFREFSLRGLERKEALQESMKTAGWAVIVSNVILMGGFFTLMLSNFEPIRRVAVLTIVAIAASLVSTLITLPPQLWLLGVTNNRKRAA